MPIIYDKEKRIILDNETGRRFSVRRTNHYQKYTNYWFLDGEQKYELGTNWHNEPHDPAQPIKKSIHDVIYFSRVNSEGLTENDPKDYVKYKPIIKEMLLMFLTEGADIEDMEYELIINF